MITTPRIAAGFFIAALLWLGAWWSYTAGYDAGKARSDATLAAARLQAQEERADAIAKLAAAHREMIAVQADAGRRIAEATRKAGARKTIVQKVIHENPTFAATTRPDAVDRVRDEQLAELGDAAARGADLSARGIRGLRGAGDRAR